MEKFADIIPNPVLLTGRVGETIKKEVRITPGKKYPFTITGSHARYGANIQFSLDKKNLFGKKTFVLDIESTRKTAGRYTDYIYLDTDSKIQPKLTIKIRGNIYAADTGYPHRIPRAQPPGPGIPPDRPK